MPKATFDNLAPDKRERILQRARVLFAADPYDAVSITKLVAALRIAKGSFYQYFESKADLYGVLAAEAQAIKMRIASSYAADPSAPLFEMLRGLYVGGLAFMRQEPLHAQILGRMIEPSVDAQREMVRRTADAQAIAWAKEVFAAAKSRGEVRPDLDVSVAAGVLIATMTAGLTVLFESRAGIALRELATAPNAGALVDEQALFSSVDALLEILQQGMAPKGT